MNTLCKTKTKVNDCCSFTKLILMKAISFGEKDNGMNILLNNYSNSVEKTLLRSDEDINTVI